MRVFVCEGDARGLEGAYVDELEWHELKDGEPAEPGRGAYRFDRDGGVYLSVHPTSPARKILVRIEED